MLRRLAALLGLLLLAVAAAAPAAARGDPQGRRRPRSLAQAAPAPAPQPALQPTAIRPEQTYYPSKGVVAVPSTAVVGPPLNVTATSADSLEGCAASCRGTRGCDWFWYCPTAGGCRDGSGGTLPFQQCRLVGEACQLPALARSNSTAVQVVSGELADAVACARACQGLHAYTPLLMLPVLLAPLQASPPPPCLGTQPSNSRSCRCGRRGSQPVAPGAAAVCWPPLSAGARCSTHQPIPGILHCRGRAFRGRTCPVRLVWYPASACCP